MFSKQESNSLKKFEIAKSLTQIIIRQVLSRYLIPGGFPTYELSKDVIFALINLILLKMILSHTEEVIPPKVSHKTITINKRCYD